MELVESKARVNKARKEFITALRQQLQNGSKIIKIHTYRYGCVYDKEVHLRTEECDLVSLFYSAFDGKGVFMKKFTSRWEIGLISDLCEKGLL